jgi:bacterioferritin-associated ferredoxin
MDIKGRIQQRPDYVICVCMGVMYSEVVAAIEQGSKTFEELSEKLMVGTGCVSCVDEIEELLDECSRV